MNSDFATGLVFPAHWSPETRARYQRLADMGKVDQAEVDRIELVLQWFRNVRDEFAKKERAQ